MKIPILDLKDISIIGQYAKCREEIKELKDALIDANENFRDDMSNTLEECIDLLQATFGLLLKISCKEEGLLKALMLHTLKLQSREANGGFKIEGWIKLEIRREDDNT